MPDYTLDKNDHYWMSEALALAQKAKGMTSPNPCVGAILVRNQKLLGKGYHRKAGGPHAEVLAVRDARRKGVKIQGATLYVTLEPCSTHGRTPPCSDLIIREKIARVVIGAVDPNPAHQGEGLKILRGQGIQVKGGVLKEECAFLNRDFNHWMRNQTPWVTLKSAMSYDGRITRPSGESTWLTSPGARIKGHELRGESDAILIGGETLRKDDPALTVRNPEYKAKLQPWRVVVTQGGDLPKSSQLFCDLHRERTLVYRNQPLLAVLKDLGKRGVMNLLVEGGGKVHAAFLKENLANELALFWAPMITGTEALGFHFSEENPLKTSIHFKPWWTGFIGKELCVRVLIEGSKT